MTIARFFLRALLAAWLIATANDLPAAEGLPGDFPTSKKKWQRAANEEGFAVFEKEVQALMSLPADKVEAHPAAVDFPGVPPADAKIITRKIAVDTRIPRCHSTGLYAAPGQVVTVTAPTNSRRIVRLAGATWASAGR